MREEVEHIELRTNYNGLIQVWNTRNNEVLIPDKYSWYPECQSTHDFMFFNSKEVAVKQALVALNRANVNQRETLAAAIEELEISKDKFLK